ncbi:MAG: PolC-type DNA polymerase III [Ruminococcaceae bacterium]|nr:PolC-type DNA polymerase III [Oscillospiraceae bacterium]
MAKTFLEIFNKYKPRGDIAELLEAASDIRIQADKENRMLQAHVSFPFTIKKDTLYLIQKQIEQAYELNRVTLFPHYPADLFDESYVPELMCETENIGIVAKGFFSKYRYNLENSTLTVEIPFSIDGVSLLIDARTPEIMQGIIRSEFGLNIKVNIIHSDDMSFLMSNNSLEQAIKEYDEQMGKAALLYESRRAEERTLSEQTAAQDVLPRIDSIFKADHTPIIENGTCKIGHAKFDISQPEYFYGDAFTIQPISIASISKPQRNITVIGTVSDFTKELNRAGDKYNITFAIFDGSASIEVKCFSLTPEDADLISEGIKNGSTVALYGYAKKETRKDRTEGTDFQFFFSHAAKIKKIPRKDNAPVKRVELHLHTNMSFMDALIHPDEAVKQAKEWGHPAIAITDHGNVQGYQQAMLTSEKTGQKVIYGMEAYFVNNTASAIFGKFNESFDAEAIVFDIETTGLSVQNDRITEIGAVKIKNGEIIDTFDIFVNPEMEISQEITELTSITNEMVKDAPKCDEALRMFFDFINKTSPEHKPLLIAHNATFDTGFIRAAAQRYGMPFDYPYLDTLPLSRFLNPDLKKHKLDIVAKHYNLEEFHHHRACDDAGILAQIYFKMSQQMKERDISNFTALSRDMNANADPLKGDTYHQIILVKNKVGLKNLYKLVSYSNLKYFKKRPRIPKTELEAHREGLIIGSACEAGELFRAILENKPESEIEEIVNFYDYLEIQPLSNNRFLIADGKAKDEEDLRNFNRKIVELGERYNKPVVATCDAHFMNEEDEIYRQILLAGQKYSDYDTESKLYFRTTDEMLEEFSYLGENKAYEVVVTNTNLINDMIDSDIRPFPKGTFTPNMDGAEEDLQRICYERAKSMYGDPLPDIVANRLDKELTSIIKNGFAVLYMIAQKLVWYSESQGYLVGSRGSVGSSFVASMAGISEVNPLPAHYWCPNCQYNDFSNPDGAGSGFDLPDKMCPVCGTKLKADGHNIPFETFLGFYGEKSPDIDLNFSGEVQGRVHKYTEELFGAENVFRAGTIGTLADKTAYGYIQKYLEDKGVSLSRAEVNRMVSCCVGVKRSTGQHPGGIVVVPKEYEIYDFCPVQHPADDPTSDIVTTHFTFEYLHDTLLKLDELGHDIPTKYKYLEKYSNTSVMDVPMNDRAVYDLFLSTKPLGIEPEDIDCNIGTFGLPEFGTRFVIKMVEEAKPRSFADLLQISGLSHGTDVWTGNAQDLINQGVCDISHVIGCRDNIMNDLIAYGVESPLSFKIMEAVRKGKGLTPEWEAAMKAANVPDWYIGSCKKIKYMFPKAHAAAYVMSAIRLGWYKVHKPLAFYCAMLTVAPGGFDAAIVMGGKRKVVETIRDIDRRVKEKKEVSQKEIQSLPVLQLVNEIYARGIKFLPINIKKSDASAFEPEDGKIRMPFSALGGLGENAAANIVAARNEEPFFSVEDLQIRAKLTKSVIEVLRTNGVLEGLDETDQLSFF